MVLSHPNITNKLFNYDKHYIYSFSIVFNIHVI